MIAFAEKDVKRESTLNDDEIVALVSHSESRRAGVELLFSAYSGPFKRYFIKHGLTKAQAEDLAQDVFVNIVRSIGEFRGDCPLEAWLWKIARNALISFVRQNRDDTGLDDDVLDRLAGANSNLQFNPTESAGLKECVSARFSAFARKYPDRAQTLALLVFKDWDIPALARILNRTGGATREYLSQCRKLIRPFLEDCLGYLRS